MKGFHSLNFVNYGETWASVNFSVLIIGLSFNLHFKASIDNWLSSNYRLYFKEKVTIVKTLEPVLGSMVNYCFNSYNFLNSLSSDWDPV